MTTTAQTLGRITTRRTAMVFTKRGQMVVIVSKRYSENARAIKYFGYVAHLIEDGKLRVSDERVSLWKDEMTCVSPYRIPPTPGSVWWIIREKAV